MFVDIKTPHTSTEDSLSFVSDHSSGSISYSSDTEVGHSVEEEELECRGRVYKREDSDVYRLF